MSDAFPIEIFDTIITFVDTSSDLLSLALSSSALKELIIPLHIEYRTIRVADISRTPHLWTHLIQFPRLAENVRSLTFGVTSDCLPPSLTDTTNISRPYEPWQLVYRALQNLCLLTRFDWHVPTGSSHNNGGKNIWDALHKCSSLRHLGLYGFIGSHLDQPQDIDEISVWQISNLESLVFWNYKPLPLSTPPNSSHIFSMLERSPLLKNLTINNAMTPDLSTHLSKCHIPYLRSLKFRIDLPALADPHLSDTENVRYAQFLHRHDTIMDLDWCTFHTPESPFTLKDGSLPNLRHLTGNSDFVLSVLNNPLPSHARRPIEFLRGFDLTLVDSLNLFKDAVNRNIDSGMLKTLGLTGCKSANDLRDVIRMFPNLTTLDLPGKLAVDYISIGHTKEWWERTLSSVPSLKILGSGKLLVRLLGRDNMIKMVKALVTKGVCPHLRRLDWKEPSMRGMTLERTGDTDWRQKFSRHVG